MTHTHELARESPERDEADVVAEFVSFLKSASARRTPTGPMPRFNQGRASGCVAAEVTVPDDLPDELKVGVFAHGQTYSGRIRFAHAASEAKLEENLSRAG